MCDLRNSLKRKQNAAVSAYTETQEHAARVDKAKTNGELPPPPSFLASRQNPRAVETMPDKPETIEELLHKYKPRSGVRGVYTR